MEPKNGLLQAKVCKVCGEAASGFHYNGNLSCKPCKIFFCRNYNKLKILKCTTKTDHCDIDHTSRRFCSRCRLLKCMKIGMEKALDETEQLSDQRASQAANGRIIEDNFDRLFLSKMFNLNSNSLNTMLKQTISKRKRRKRRTPQRLSVHEQQVIEQLQNALSAAFEDERKLPVVRNVSSAEEAFEQHCLYARRIVSFMKSMPPFKALGLADQFTILKAFFLKVLVLRCAFHYNPELQGYPMIEDETGTRAVFLPLSRESKGDQPKGQKALQYSRNQVRLIYPQLENDATIRDLLIAQALFQPLSSLSSAEFICYHFNRYKSILFNYLQLKYHNRQRAQLKFCSLQNILKKFENITINSKQIFISKFKNFENANEILKDLFNLT